MSKGVLEQGGVCLLTKAGGGEITREKRIYVGFIGLEKAYDRIDREASW